LDGSEVDSQVFERYHKSSIMLWGSKIALQGYVNAYMAGDIDNNRRTIGYVFTIGGTTHNWV